MKFAIIKKKYKHYDRIVTIKTHPEMMGWAVLGINVLDMNVIKTLVNYSCPIKTTPCANLTFSDLNNNSLNPAEDLGNLPTDYTQSEITAKLSDPKLSGELFNSVNSPLTGKEGRVTAVVAKHVAQRLKMQPMRTSHTLQGVAPVTLSSRFY